MYTTNFSKALLDLLKGSNEGTPQSNRSPGQAYQEERNDIRLESYDKERSLSPRELHKWKKSLFSVYVGRLPTDVTVRELVRFSSQVGVPKDAFVLPPEGNKSYTFGFLRYGTLEEARKAVSCMNGRILGNRHVLVEISAETRAILNSKDKEDGVCAAQDRLIRKEYPTFRRPSPDNEEEFVQSKLLQSIAKLKSDQVNVVNAGYKDSEESNGPSFLDQLEEILKKVIKEVPGETTTKSTADEGPVCTIRLEDMRLNPTETPKTTQSVESPPVRNIGNHLSVDREHCYPGSAGSKIRDVPQDSPVTPKSPESLGSLSVNGEKHSPINTVHTYGKPVQNAAACHPGYVGVDMRQNMLQHSPETLKTDPSLGSPPSNGEKHSPTNTVHPYGKPVQNAAACHPGYVGLDMRQNMLQHSPETLKTDPSLGSPPSNGEKHSPTSTVHPYGKPVQNAAACHPGYVGLEMRQNMLQHSPEVLKIDPSLGSPSVNGEKHSPIANSWHPRGKPADNSIANPGSVGMCEDMQQNTPKVFQRIQSPCSPPMNSENDSPVNSNDSHVRPSNAITSLTKSMGLTNALSEPLPKHYVTAPVETRKPDSHYTTKATLRGDDLPMQQLTTSDWQSNRKGPSLNRYVLSKMRDMPCQDARQFQSEKRPVAPCKMSPTATQISPMSSTNTALDAAALTPLSSKGNNELSSLKILDAQRQISSSAAKDNIGIHGHIERPSFSFRERISYTLDEKSGNTSQVATNLPGMMQGSTQRAQQSHSGEITGSEERMIGVSPKAEERGNDTKMQASKKPCQPYTINKEKDREEISLQQAPTFGQNQLKEQIPLQQGQLLPGNQQQTLLQDRQKQPPLEQEQPPCQEQLSLQDRQQQSPLQDKQEQPPLEQDQPPCQEQLSFQDRQQQPPLQDKQKHPPLEQKQPPRQEQLSLQDRQQQPPLQGKQEHPPLEQKQPPRQEQLSLQDRQQQPPLQDKQEQPPLEQEQPSFQDQTALEDRQSKMPLRDKQEQTPLQHQREQISLQDQEKQPPFEDHNQMSFDDRQQQLASRDKQAHTSLQGQQKQMPLQQWEPAFHDQPLPLQDQQVQPPLQQQQMLLKQRSVHELQLKLGVILKENERLHTALPEHYKDKRTSGMYPDKEMSNLEESIHNYEVKYQREIEITAARNAEHELLYEREKLSAAFDTNLQKELDLELRMEVLKNEIKLANMANQLLVFYQKRNDMQ